MVCHPSRTYLPKGFGQELQNRSFSLSPPPNHTPFTFYLWPMTPPHPILAGYRLVVPGPCGCFPFRYVQKSACYSCVCRDLEARRPCFFDLLCGLFFVFPLHSKVRLCLMMGLTFLWSIFGFLYFLQCCTIIPAVITQSCWPLLGQLFIPSLSGLTWPLFCFYLWAPMSLWAFLWAFMARLLSLGFPGPITLDSSLGFMGLP